MYVRNGLSISRLLLESRHLLAVSLALSLLVYLVHDRLGFEALELPALPVATLGIVVSLYLGFVSASAYARWWEARTVWGEIVNSSRSWANSCLVLADLGAEGSPAEEVRRLVRRHLAWVNALCFQLRPPPAPRSTEGSPGVSLEPSSSKRYVSFLSPREAASVTEKANPAVHILRLQGDSLRRMRQAGRLDDYHLAELVRSISNLYDSQGRCERIKNTPFPVQFTYFGRIFTWTFIVLLPFAFVDSFIRLADNYPVISTIANDYVYALVPFNVLTSWVFFLLQRISESCLDPFDGKPTDVPIAALTRLIEIDLLQMLHDSDIPEPCSPKRGVLQ